MRKFNNFYKVFKLSQKIKLQKYNARKKTGSIH
jgi:hypothetical protein